MRCMLGVRTRRSCSVVFGNALRDSDGILDAVSSRASGDGIYSNYRASIRLSACGCSRSAPSRTRPPRLIGMRIDTRCACQSRRRKDGLVMSSSSCPTTPWRRSTRASRAEPWTAARVPARPQFRRLCGPGTRDADGSLHRRRVDLRVLQSGQLVWPTASQLSLHAGCARGPVHAGLHRTAQARMGAPLWHVLGVGASGERHHAVGTAHGTCAPARVTTTGSRARRRGWTRTAR